jgi:4-hydroxybenzoate polyprenyltransferase
MSVPWFIFIGFVVVTTVHAQDFEDMDGDAARKRWTVPLVIGEYAARWFVSLAVPFWSLLIPCYFRSHALGYMGPTLLAAIVVYRYLAKRDKEENRKSFRIWNLWTVSLYIVPFYVSGKHHG